MLKQNRPNPFCCFIVILILFMAGSASAQGIDPCEDPPATPPAYNDPNALRCDPNNPSEISPGESLPIGVINGYPGYSWSVSGTGFSLEDEQTQGPSNILYAGADACGTAEITVTDAAGRTETCHVTSTAMNLTWAPQNPQGIKPGNQITVKVLNGRGPFKWELTMGGENGFSLNEEETGRTNVLFAGAEACENANITVSDVCSGQVMGTVKALRCTGSYIVDDEWNITEYTGPYTKRLQYRRTTYDCNDGGEISQRWDSCVCSGDICERIVAREYGVGWGRECMNPMGFTMCGASYCLKSIDLCDQDNVWCAGQVHIDNTCEE